MPWSGFADGLEVFLIRGSSPADAQFSTEAAVPSAAPIALEIVNGSARSVVARLPPFDAVCNRSLW